MQKSSLAEGVSNRRRVRFHACAITALALPLCGTVAIGQVSLSLNDASIRGFEATDNDSDILFGTLTTDEADFFASQVWDGLTLSARIAPLAWGPDARWTFSLGASMLGQVQPGAQVSLQYAFLASATGGTVRVQALNVLGSVVDPVTYLSTVRRGFIPSLTLPSGVPVSGTLDLAPFPAGGQGDFCEITFLVSWTGGQAGDTFEFSIPEGQMRLGVVDGGCRPDLNGDGILNVQDLLAFMSDYSYSRGEGDFNGDGIVNIQDFLGFLDAYAAGC